jgi:hypothetical protein
MRRFGGLGLGLAPRGIGSAVVNPAVDGDLIEAEVLGVGPVSGQGTIDSNGRIIRMRFKGMTTGQAVDISKCTITVTLPGWNTSKVYSSTNLTQTMGVRGEVRKPYNQHATKLSAAVGSDVDVYFFLDRAIPKAPSAVTSIVLTSGFYGTSNAITFSDVVNNSTRDFKVPQLGYHQQRYWGRMTDAGLDVEVCVDHAAARALQTVAVVEPYVHVGATEYGSVAINSMTQSDRLSGRPYQLSVYKGTVPRAGCPNGEAALDTRVYPWVGDTVWDTATAGIAPPTNSDCPAGLPINCDADGSYTDVGAYVSATGVQIGSPSIKPLGSLGSYASEGAYATAAAVAAAVRTYNNNGANRTRVHDDLAGGWALAPNGNLIAGLGANISSVTTYPVGLGWFTLGREAGSTKATTGWTYASTGTNKTTTRRFRIYDCAVVPGASGSANHTVFQQNSGQANVAAKPTMANACFTLVEACVGSGGNDNTNAVILNKGFCWHWNNDFTDFGGSPFAQSTSFYAGVVEIAGCDLNNAGSSSASAIECGAVFATRARQLRYDLPNPSGVNKPFPDGPMLWNTSVDIEGSSAISSNISIGGNSGLAIGPRGWSTLGVSSRRTRAGFSAIGDSAPTLQIAADYNTGAGTDQADIQNLNIRHVSCAGTRGNILYNEANGTPVYKERDADILGWATHQKNNKGDLSVAGGGQNGARMGPLPYRYGQNVCGVVSGDISSNATGIAIGADSWLGEVVPPNSQDNVGYANMYTTDTSLVGTNVAANPMNWTPLTALRNRIPAGRAVVPYDRLGTPMRNDGTGAAGCLSY